jgi:hypothetical protein
MLYNIYMKTTYPERYEICGGCNYLLGDVCKKIDLPLVEFINLRLAYCPDFRWG